MSVKHVNWIVVFLLVSLNLSAQQVIPLYPGAIPNSKSNAMKEVTAEDHGRFYGYRNISQPTLTVFLPDKKDATGAAVIICPGGGYGVESYRLEGTVIAEAFLKRGIAGIVLKYRLPSDSIMPDKSVGPLQDAQQAIKITRERAAAWNLDPGKIGIMGFSAGGHLASTAGTHFDVSYIPNEEKTDLRPGFMILVYPVISMTEELTHKGSRQNLLGKDPGNDKIMLFSNELHIHSNTPPTWLTHTGDDKVVTVENSIRFYQELIRNNVPAEMHLYPSGNHGFVLSQPTDMWMEPLFTWMKNLGMIAGPK
jgi:acetyl esterase/lipase